jgi:hypothetical protein
LPRSLGHETITPEGRLVDEAIEADVITIVFPGSGVCGFPSTPEKIRQIGGRLFLALGGTLPNDF